MNPTRRDSIRTIVSTLVGTAVGSAAHAQADWPARAVRFVVPVAPGGSADMLARTLGERLAKAFGQPFVVENVSGGGGVIATQSTARATADGHLVMLSYSATHSTNPAVRKVPYDFDKDFTPIAMIGGTPNVLVVNASINAASFRDFIALLKAGPTKYSYGSAGLGTLTHLAMEQLKESTRTFMVHVPYRGGSPMMADLVGGQINAAMPSLSTALPHIRGGRIRALAVTSSKRHPALPDTPTLAELGLKGFETVQWYGVHGPAGMPPAVVRRLNEGINKQIAAPDLQEKLAQDAITVTPMSPEQFRAYVQRDGKQWVQLVQSRKLVVE
ncbi:MAG TPA: tripartite tricarboxylate transporter substrate binding protein [Ramlibacter sp.]|jgi:tripartite-type tricarboxylate transporter receptor subunit TctC|nr:tripartite tricarboxylate transporter substrate binding protein [Ramlibacter sp.]